MTAPATLAWHRRLVSTATTATTTRVYVHFHFRPMPGGEEEMAFSDRLPPLSVPVMQLASADPAAWSTWTVPSPLWIVERRKDSATVDVVRISVAGAPLDAADAFYYTLHDYVVDCSGTLGDVLREIQENVVDRQRKKRKASRLVDLRAFAADTGVSYRLQRRDNDEGNKELYWKPDSSYIEQATVPTWTRTVMRAHGEDRVSLLTTSFPVASFRFPHMLAQILERETWWNPYLQPCRGVMATSDARADPEVCDDLVFDLHEMAADPDGAYTTDPTEDRWWPSFVRTERADAIRASLTLASGTRKIAPYATDVLRGNDEPYADIERSAPSGPGPAPAGVVAAWTLVAALVASLMLVCVWILVVSYRNTDNVVVVIPAAANDADAAATDADASAAATRA